MGRGNRMECRGERKKAGPRFILKAALANDSCHEKKMTGVAFVRNINKKAASSGRELPVHIKILFINMI